MKSLSGTIVYCILQRVSEIKATFGKFNAFGTLLNDVERFWNCVELTLIAIKLSHYKVVFSLNLGL